MGTISLEGRTYSRLLLTTGDLTAFLLFVVIGRISHGLTTDWLPNLARIATPFLIGWIVAALLLGAYTERHSLSTERHSLSAGRFLLNSLLAVLLADLLAFGLRAFLFHNNVTVPFALTTLLFTVLFVVGWRLIFLWIGGVLERRNVEALER